MVFARLFHTIRYLRLVQVVYRVFYRIRPSFRVSKRYQVESYNAQCMEWPSYFPASTEDCREFRFLGLTGNLDEGWNSHRYSKLWRYNLHYLNDLNSIRANEKSELMNKLVNCWIESNPPVKGDGWEAYPLSIRIVNLVKWYSRRFKIDQGWLNSLAQQADALMRQREFHILGNHLFENGKALVFAGAFLSGGCSERWLNAGLRILDREIPEQFLTDGAHFELSPMYHATLLWDMCDLVALAQWSELDSLLTRAVGWQEVISNGIQWLRGMVHPDGGVSFFNDAAFGIAPTLGQIESYAEKLKCSRLAKPISQVKRWNVFHHVASGYVTVDYPGVGNRAIIDLAKVGPDYQPGHAHADSLSFELSLFGQRVFVNSGISQYGEDEERQRQRSTSAHNTVEVDGDNSSEVWGGFRVARRAFPSCVHVESRLNKVLVSGEHNGYRRLKGKVNVRREWQFENACIVVRDILTGQFSSAVSRLYCHPQLHAFLTSGNEVRIDGVSGGAINLQVEGARKIRVVKSEWHPEFGVTIPNQCIEMELEGTNMTFVIQWGCV